MNWQSIEANYDVKMNQAETALADIKENKEASEKIEASKMKYEALKLLFKLKWHQCQALNNKCVTLCWLKIGDDMNFDWVNATNILGVYINL
jgi:hypothetical protein